MKSPIESTISIMVSMMFFALFFLIMTGLPDNVTVVTAYIVTFTIHIFSGVSFIFFVFSDSISFYYTYFRGDTKLTKRVYNELVERGMAIYMWDHDDVNR